MKLSGLGNNQTVATVAGILAVAAIGYLILRKGGEAVAVVVDKVNPSSPNNFVYDDIYGGVGKSISGDENWTLGGWIYDVFNPEVYATENIKESPWYLKPFKPYVPIETIPKDKLDPWYTIKLPLPKTQDLQKINPASRENIIYKGLNSGVANITGDDSWTLGGWIYDLVND